MRYSVLVVPTPAMTPCRVLVPCALTSSTGRYLWRDSALSIRLEVGATLIGMHSSRFSQWLVLQRAEVLGADVLPLRVLSS